MGAEEVKNGNGNGKVKGMTPGAEALMLDVARYAQTAHGLEVEKSRPTEAVLCLEMLAQGKTYREIERATGFNFTTIRLLGGRHERPLAQRRQELALHGFELAEGFRHLILKKQERMAEDDEMLDKASLKELSISYAIVQDKAFEALGENTQRIVVEHKRGASIEDVQAAIAAARAKVAEINVTPVGGVAVEDGEETEEQP